LSIPNTVGAMKANSRDNWNAILFMPYFSTSN
jgi:hypothetical protein